MPERKVPGENPNPPEYPQSLRLRIVTRYTDSFSTRQLPRSVRKAIIGFEGRELENIPEEELGEAQSEYSIIAGGPMTDLQNIRYSPGESAIVTAVIDADKRNLAAIGIAFLKEKNSDLVPLDVFFGRASDDPYRRKIAPFALAVLHRALQERGIASYTTHVWEVSERFFNEQGVQFKEVAEENTVPGQMKVEVKVDSSHTKQLFTQLGLDYDADPFTTTYRQTVTPLPPKT